MILILVVIALIVIIVACNRSGKSANAVKEKTQLEIQQLKEQKEKPFVNVADEILKLKDLKDKGIITEDEFSTLKAKLLK
jgi:septation ring formation regulator EzrA